MKNTAPSISHWPKAQMDLLDTPAFNIEVASLDAFSMLQETVSDKESQLKINTVFQQPEESKEAEETAQPDGRYR